MFAINGDDGAITSTPFFIRFGKFKVFSIPATLPVKRVLSTVYYRNHDQRCRPEGSMLMNLCDVRRQVFRSREKRVFLTVNGARIDLEMRVSTFSNSSLLFALHTAALPWNPLNSSFVPARAGSWLWSRRVAREPR